MLVTYPSGQCPKEKTTMARRRTRRAKRSTHHKKAKGLTVAKKKQVRKAIAGLKKLL